MQVNGFRRGKLMVKARLNQQITLNGQQNT